MALCMKATRAVAVKPARSSVKAQASLQNVAKAAGLSLASFGVVLAAQAVTVKMGTDNGGLAFDPATVEIASGESVTWLNNKAGPHNVIFDSDAVPEGVSEDDADALSIADQVTADGTEVKRGPFKVAGTYSYYCEPHQGAGMVGKIVVK